MTAPAVARVLEPLRVRLSAGARMLLDDLFHYRRRYRRVIPTTAALAERHGVSRPTVKRWLAELRAAGVLVSIYNGGQGMRCVYYVGPRAAERALEENPAWTLEHGGKSTFGALRMGRSAVAKRTAKDLKNEILNPSDSSSTERGTPSESPPSENQAAEAPAAVRSESPQRPPAGGSEPATERLELVGASPAVEKHDTPQPALEPLRPDEPPTPAQAPARPPRGAPSAMGASVRKPRSIAKDRWDLWCRAWGLWRAYAARARGGPPKDHPTDLGAMKALLARALMRYRGAEELALDDLAWGFRAYTRDPRDRFKPLARLARTREEYGRPPENFRAPWRREEIAPNAAGGLPPAPSRRPTPASSGDVSAGAAPAPAPKLSLVELARRDLRRAEQALELGFGSPRAVERAKKLLGELEAKERPGS